MTTIAVELMPDEGAPQVGVTVTGLETGAQIISVQMSWDAGDSWRTVTGGDHVDAVGGAFIRDHFPPLNVEAIWRVIEHSVSGEPTTESTPLTVESTTAWIQDPLNPRDAISLTGYRPVGEETALVWGTAADAMWSQSVDMVQVLGADRPVASVGQRMVAGQVPLKLTQEAAIEGGKFRRLLLSSGHLVLRLDYPNVLEPVAHIVIGDAREQIIKPADGSQISTWDLTVTQVRPLSLKFVIPWWTYQQVKDLYVGQTYAAVAASKPGASYLDWQKDPTP